MTTCSYCDGFHWVPEGEAGKQWYQRDWRLLLDSSVKWTRCPECGQDQPFMKQLHLDLSKVLLQRIDQELSDRAANGLWLTGLLDKGQHMCRWKDIACVWMDEAADRWMIFSVMGVTDVLSREQCNFFLSQAGAPPLPSIEA